MTTPKHKRIGPYDATLDRVGVDGADVALWQVCDLERYVDRAALLAGDDPPEPPYWAHLWSGARVLAAAVPADAGRVVEIGCGLGLPGLVAACRGGSVVFVDHERVALEFVAESARANGVDEARCVAADFVALPFRERFDLVLAAEIVYERTGFVQLASALSALARLGGRVLLTDGQRIDTRFFYAALEAAGLVWEARVVRVLEDGFPVDIRLVDARRG